MLQIILYILGILALIESVIILIFSKQIKKTLKKITNQKNYLRNLALIELIIGVIIILIAYFF
jgi:uncharacterized protein YjeT (DUF2065 family)